MLAREIAARAKGGGAPVDGAAAAADADTAALVEAAAKFDLARHRKQNDDGHLSSTRVKRQLRGLILNDTRLSLELAEWRAATGYDRSYRAHCRRWSVPWYDQAVADGLQPVVRRRRVRRRRSRRRAR